MFDNYLNPLMLRELRQSVRDNSTVFLINVFIAVMVFFCVTQILLSFGEESGKELFSTISAITNGACLIIVVIVSAISTAKQRKDNDLMFTSALSPWSLITGKWLAGAVITLLLLSLSAPFVAVAYLLRGIDLQDITLSFINTFFIVQFLNAAGIAAASLARNQAQSSFLSVIGFIGLMYGGGAFIGSAFFFTYGSFAHTVPYWFILISYLAALLPLTVLLLIGTAALSPPTSNRILPVRIALTAVFLLSFAVRDFLTLFASGIPFGISISGWFSFWTVFIIMFFILTVHERQEWCFRIRRTIPKNFILRLFCFPFYSGSPCGIVWTVLLFAAALGVFCNSQPFPFDTLFTVCTVWYVVFAFDYCVTAMLLVSLTGRNSQTPVFAVVLFLLLTFTLGSLLLSFLLFTSTVEFLGNDFYSVYRYSPFSALNPFLLNADSYVQWFGAGIWFIVLMPFFAVWFIRRVKNFTPQGSDDAMTLEQAVEAVNQEKANVR